MDATGDAAACEECGSQEFHDEDGRTVCENGHIQVGGLRVAEGDDEFGTQGKRVRKKEEKTKVKVSKVFRGKQAYRLFLQAYQFILWKQCYSLVHEKRLPPELWTVVRDLWTLRLSKLLHRFEDGSGPDGDRPSATESREESEVENANFPTSTADAGRSPTLNETIVLCYIGILLLRLPVGLSSIFKWVRGEEIAYIRAIRHIPADMRAKLPGEYHESLDTMFLMTRDDLQTAVFHLSKIYHRSFRMAIPPINWVLLLFEYVKSLALPLEVYQAAKRLNKVVDFKFKFDFTQRRRKAVSFPEAQLMSLVVVAVKLLYPFDSDTVRRYPRSLNESATQIIDWTAWTEMRKISKDPGVEKGGLPKGEELEVKDVNIFSMSGEQLDNYMDWYQKMWAKTEPSGENVNRELLDMFPLKPISETVQEPDSEVQRDERIWHLLKESQSSLKMRRPISDEEAREIETEIIRPGMQYTQYRTVEDLNVVPSARAFYEAAADNACLSLETLTRAVVQTERKITIWRKAKRRAETFGDEMDLDAEAGLVSGLEDLEELDILDDLTGPDDSGGIPGAEDSGSEMETLS